MYLKKIIGIFVLSLLCFSFSTNNVSAQESSSEEKIDIYLFYSETCPHCKDEEKFLNKLIEEDERINLKQFEVTKSDENWQLFRETLDKFNVKSSEVGVPFTIINDQYFVGWRNEETTGKDIKAIIDKSFDKNIINLPLFGEMDVRNISLPFLTFAIALLDGFNPCAMWTLIFLITLLLGMKDRRKMWILGMAFIGVSAFVYFLFLSAWLQLFVSIGAVFWIRIIIGIVAIGAGVYSLKKYFTQPVGVCNVTSGQKTQKVFDRLKILIQEKSFFIALVGISALAFVVNLVELACSAGFPAIYTKVLAMSDLPTYQYYLYLIFYVLIFMLDDLIVFFLAMSTLRVANVNTKYSKISELVGGIIMLIIGLLLIFKAEWLSFGM